jgi:hypothetical protein
MAGFCQKSGHEAKTALVSARLNAVFEFDWLALRAAFPLNKGVVP